MGKQDSLLAPPNIHCPKYVIFIGYVIIVVALSILGFVWNYFGATWYAQNYIPVLGYFILVRVLCPHILTTKIQIAIYFAHFLPWWPSLITRPAFVGLERYVSKETNLVVFTKYRFLCFVALALCFGYMKWYSCLSSQQLALGFLLTSCLSSRTFFFVVVVFFFWFVCFFLALQKGFLFRCVGRHMFWRQTHW